jgi:hypothetical protein
MSEFDKASDTFVLWLRDNDATVSDSIAIKDFRSQNAGRGVVAVKDIKVCYNTTRTAKKKKKIQIGQLTTH